MPFDPLIHAPARRVEVLAFPDVQLLDVAGPVQVLATVNDLSDHQAYEARVVAQGAGTTASSSGLRLATEPLPPADAPLDTLIVAGGPGVRAACRDAALVNWVRARAQ